MDRDTRIKFFEEGDATDKTPQEEPIHPKHHSGSFDRAAIDKILAQPGCARLRYYHGRDKNGRSNLILVSVNAEGKDMRHA